jgi:hypothetical protein
MTQSKMDFYHKTKQYKNDVKEFRRCVFYLAIILIVLIASKYLD